MGQFQLQIKGESGSIFGANQQFDVNLVQVDAAVLGAMYSTGTFAELKLQPPNTLTFRFFGGIDWRMVLLNKREFAIPFLSDPSGVSREFKFFRYFRIQGKALPQGAPDASDTPRGAGK